MDIMTRIENNYPTMTKKQKQIADYMKTHADNMTFVTLKELSQEIGITEITVLNMCKALGYTSFNEVKYEFRKYVNQNKKIDVYKNNDYYTTSVPEEERQDKENNLAEICREELSLMENFARNFDCGKFLKVAEEFLKYKRIILCGRGVSYLLCEHLYTRLAILQVPVMKVNTELSDDVYSVLPVIDSDTLVVAAYFPDYYFMTSKVAAYAKKAGAKLILITDSGDTDVSKIADEKLTVQSTTRMTLNTLSTPMALINMLASAIQLQSDKTHELGEEFGKMF